MREIDKGVLWEVLKPIRCIADDDICLMDNSAVQGKAIDMFYIVRDEVWDRSWSPHLRIINHPKFIR